MSSTAESGIDPAWLWRMGLNSSIMLVNIHLKVHFIQTLWYLAIFTIWFCHLKYIFANALSCFKEENFNCKLLFDVTLKVNKYIY